MTPDYQDNACTLYRGDCLDVLPTLKPETVDLVLTDPPYCSGAMQDAGKQRSKPQGHRTEVSSRPGFHYFGSDAMTTGGLIWTLRAAMTVCAALLRPNRSALIFSDWRMAGQIGPAIESTGLAWKNVIVWDKGRPGLGRGFRPSHELILEFGKGKPEYTRYNGRNVIQCPVVPSGLRVHTTEKPLKLLRDIIELTTNPGAVVLDPFAGSAAVGVAATLAGRRFIGIERDPRHFETATARLNYGATADHNQPVQ